MRFAQNNNVTATTIIEYEVFEHGPTWLHVMDILGRSVAELVDGVVEASRYSIPFEASAISSGTYLYVLPTPTQRFHKLMEVAK